MTYKNNKSRYSKYNRNPNSKSNRFKGQKVEKSKLIDLRKKLYNECKEAGMSDMQALIKCLEISPKD